MTLELGRTYAATSHMCSKNGYRSMPIRSLGDPERDQWHIDNPNQQKVCAA